MTAEARPNREPRRVALRGIAKSFPGVRALRGVDLEVDAGEIHALCGENGAGKSTLIRVLAGAIKPDSGEILLDGAPVRFRDPADALAQGVAVIHQEFSLVGSLTAAENLALGNEPRFGPWINRRALRKLGADRLKTLGFDIDPDARVDTLSTGRRQLLEIAKALGRSGRVLILDEPTAALTRLETGRLFEALRDLKRRNIGIIYISHHLEEVAEISDRVTVLRDGARVGAWNASDTTPRAIAAAMVGEAVGLDGDSERRSPKPVGRTILEVRGLSGRTFRDVSLAFREGEIVGLSGLSGAGHEEFARVLFGIARPSSGTMLLDGRAFRPRRPRDAMKLGIASVPADRREEGLIPTWGCLENVGLAAIDRHARLGFLKPKERRNLWLDVKRDFEISAASPTTRVLTLSGGNQQKVLLARWSAVAPRLLILNDPTRGIDVKTREAVHRRIRDWADLGLSVALISSDSQELRGLSDRFVVFRAGKVVRDIPALAAEEHVLLASMLDDPAPPSGPDPCP